MRARPFSSSAREMRYRRAASRKHFLGGCAAIALHRALTQKQIADAGLDVFVEEPPAPNHPLFALPNVTLSRHSAGPTWENWIARFRNGFDNIQRVAAGDRPRWVIPELA